MAPPPHVNVPDSCKAVGPDCPIEGTIYGYWPSLEWNAFFAAFFAVACIVQVVLGIRYKTWTYMIGVGLGAVAECVGYIGRVLMSHNPYDETAFQIQIVLLIFAPAFLAAGVYLTLKHAVISFGAEWSRIRPAWYTYIFIACDISSLILQSAGGAIAATAADNDQSTSDIGTDIMIAGIIWQVVVLVIFGILVAEYCYRTYKRRDQIDQHAMAILHSRRFRYFAAAVFVAYITIFIRCVYRVPELIGGWAGELMRIESEFIVLEGWMILICVFAQTAFHPGIFFPVMGGDQQKAIQARKNASRNGSDTEMVDLP